ncbi:MAG: glycoside hydrolase family 31 protein [Aestuariibaculum sp.]
MPKLSLKILFLGLIWSHVLTAQQKQIDLQTHIIPVLDEEYWWGGAVNDGRLMPYNKPFTYNMYGNNKGNQFQPLLLSNKGRIIWSEEPFKFTVTEKTITIEPRTTIIQEQSGNTLKEAYLYASQKFFPANGKMPATELFTFPQYNTWIELMYNQNQKDILSYAHAIIDNGLPPGVLMIDDNWQEDYGKWRFHPGRFPNPKAMMAELHKLGFKVMLWVCPFVSPDSDVYRNLAKQGLFLKNPKNESNSSTFVKPEEPAMIYWWNGVSAVLDFTNPKAQSWFKEELNKLTDEYNVDGFKFDAGDTYFYPDHLIGHSKTLSPNEHTALFGKIGLDYPFNEYRAMWKMAGLPLAQRLSDKGHNWNYLNMLIPNITAQGLMGYAFTCPDLIGGGEFTSFLNTEHIDQDLIVRSAQTHALMPMMQFSVAPWRILDKEHFEAIKKTVKLREQFKPLILELAKKSAKTGEPIVRNMEYVFPNKGYHTIKDQFMLGDTILVAPFLEKNTNKRTVVLPKGKWKADNGKIFKGDRSITLTVPLDRLLYFKRL